MIYSFGNDDPFLFKPESYSLEDVSIISFFSFSTASMDTSYWIASGATLAASICDGMAYLLSSSTRDVSMLGLTFYGVYKQLAYCSAGSGALEVVISATR